LGVKLKLCTQAKTNLQSGCFIGGYCPIAAYTAPSKQVNLSGTSFYSPHAFKSLKNRFAKMLHNTYLARLF